MKKYSDIMKKPVEKGFLVSKISSVISLLLVILEPQAHELKINYKLRYLPVCISYILSGSL